MSKHKGKLNPLELGRGVAALLVVMYHIDNYYFSTPKYYTGKLLGGFFAFGHSGVEFFFVLSGFIMIWAHWKDLGQKGKIAGFLEKRFIRIYPLAAICTAAALALYLAVPTSGRADYRQPLNILYSFLLAGRHPLLSINFPSWTLWHENIFYLFCALIIYKPRWGAMALGAWALACLLTLLSDVYMEAAFYPLAPVNALFALGAGCAYYLRKHRLPAAPLFLTVGVVGFFAFGVIGNNIYQLNENILHPVFGFFALAIIASAVEMERSGRLTLPPLCARAGALSYPLYLSHMV